MTDGHALLSADRVLRNAELWVAKRLEGIGPGSYRSRQIGEGIEFSDIREYVPGDDVRAIDWNVTARTGHPHVRMYQADREAKVFILADRSASMGFGTAGKTKEQLLREVVAAVAVMVLRRGNPIGGMLFAENRLAGLPFSSGRRAALRLLQLLDDAAPREGVGSRLDLALEETERVVRRRSIIFVASDWLNAGDWAPPLGRLALRHEVIAAQITDPRETDLPPVGPLVLEDPETGRQLEVDTANPELRRAFATAAAAHQKRLSTSITSTGASHLVVSTGADWLRDLLGFLDRRRRKGRRAG